MRIQALRRRDALAVRLRERSTQVAGFIRGGRGLTYRGIGAGFVGAFLSGCAWCADQPAAKLSVEPIRYTQDQCTFLDKATQRLPKELYASLEAELSGFDKVELRDRSFWEKIEKTVFSRAKILSLTMRINRPGDPSPILVIPIVDWGTEGRRDAAKIHMADSRTVMPRLAYTSESAYEVTFNAKYSEKYDVEVGKKLGQALQFAADVAAATATGGASLVAAAETFTPEVGNRFDRMIEKTLNDDQDADFQPKRLLPLDVGRPCAERVAGWELKIAYSPRPNGNGSPPAENVTKLRLYVKPRASFFTEVTGNTGLPDFQQNGLRPVLGDTGFAILRDLNTKPVTDYVKAHLAKGPSYISNSLTQFLGATSDAAVKDTNCKLLYDALRQYIGFINNDRIATMAYLIDEIGETAKFTGRYELCLDEQQRTVLTGMNFKLSQPPANPPGESLRVRFARQITEYGQLNATQRADKYFERAGRLQQLLTTNVSLLEQPLPNKPLQLLLGADGTPMMVMELSAIDAIQKILMPRLRDNLRCGPPPQQPSNARTYVLDGVGESKVTIRLIEAGVETMDKTDCYLEIPSPAKVAAAQPPGTGTVRP